MTCTMTTTTSLKKNTMMTMDRTTEIMRAMISEEATMMPVKVVMNMEGKTSEEEIMETTEVMAVTDSTPSSNEIVCCFSSVLL